MPYIVAALVVLAVAVVGLDTWNMAIAVMTFTDRCGMHHLGPGPAPTVDWLGSCR